VILRGRRRRALLFAFLLALLSSALAAETPRQYEIYSTVSDHGADLVGTELEVLVWDDRVEATLMVYRRFVETRPVRLRGTTAGEEIDVSATQGEESLEIRGKRTADRFVGEMTYKRKGEIVRTDPLDLPRKKLKSN
jgi:hypothetical protein